MQQDKRKNTDRDQDPNRSQERNLRNPGNRDFDSENVPEPVSFGEDREEAAAIGDEDLDRVEQTNPKADDQDDIKDSR
jgi:hypothetical protein